LNNCQFVRHQENRHFIILCHKDLK
jgi:hypothetical protein